MPFYGNVNDTASTPTLNYTKDEFIVFHHGRRKVLVPLPTSYEEACTVAGELFLPDLSNSSISTKPTLLFETDELNISRGERITIHRTAWEGISRSLGNVHVVILGAAVKKEITKEPLLTATGYYDPNTTVRHPAETDQEGATEDEQDQYATRNVPKAVGTIKFKKVGASNAMIGSPMRPSPASSSKKKVASTSPRAKLCESGKNKGTKKADPLNLFPDEPFKREADSDAEECAEVAGALEGTAEPEDRMESASRNGEDNVFAGLGEMKPTSSFKTMSQVQQKPALAPPPASAPSVSNTETSTTAMATPERILVVVDYENSDAAEMKFRVKPMTTVARLMQAICKQFNLEYEKIQLHMLIDVEDDEEDGSSVERVYCPMNSTLLALGAIEGQRFVVSEIGESD